MYQQIAYNCKSISINCIELFFCESTTNVTETDFSKNTNQTSKAMLQNDTIRNLKKKSNGLNDSKMYNRICEWK